MVKITKHIYVCAPLKGDVKANHERVVKAVKKLIKEWDDSHGSHVKPLFIVPHFVMRDVTYDMEKGESNREWGMECCLELVSMCDELVVIGDNVTSGMWDEIQRAMAMGKKVERRIDL